MSKRSHARAALLPTCFSALLTALVAVLVPGAPAARNADPASAASQAGEKKVLRLPLRSTGPGSLDPVRGSTQYDHRACSNVYETLLQFKYLKRPYELEPLLLAKMPEVSADGLTYSFELKPDVRFVDDACFEGGKGRELVTDDVFYSWKRMADQDNQPLSWWLFEDTIAGFDEYREAQNAAATFDYGAPVAGFKKVDDHRFQVALKVPVHRFLYVLTMFQTSIVPREAVEHYGSEFSRHPVGSGPFVLDEWMTSQSISFDRNPTYHEELYPNDPSDWSEKDVELGLTRAAGQRLPLCDRIEVTFFRQDQPMWLEFESGKLDYGQIPAENYDQAINKRRKTLKSEYASRGITYSPEPLLDFIFHAFNMEDPLLGGYTEEKRNLRKAIALAFDLDEFNSTFYNDVVIVYDGMIPPGMDGFPEGEGHHIEGAARGPQIELAKECLAKAGYPGGEGLPVLDYYTSNEANASEQSELLQRQLARIGVEINPLHLDFAQLIKAVNTKKAPFFSFAWGSDYPDAENNLALFYGPNVSPGSNHFNYASAEYDALYEKLRTMAPSPERTALVIRMRDMVLSDVPFVGSMARTRHYLIQPWLLNCKPTEVFWNWEKYLDLDLDRAAAR